MCSAHSLPGDLLWSGGLALPAHPLCWDSGAPAHTLLLLALLSGRLSFSPISWCQAATAVGRREVTDLPGVSVAEEPMPTVSLKGKNVAQPRENFTQ